MRPIEQKIATTNSYQEYLHEWVNALNKLTFLKGKHFKTSEETEAILTGKLETNTPIDTSCFKELTDYPGGKKVILIQEIIPFAGREDFDGIWITFYANNTASFADMDYGQYKEYLKENSIKEGKKMTWQEAYDKLCDLARNEQTLIPKLNS
jgi:hypothetical protein